MKTLICDNCGWRVVKNLDYYGCERYVHFATGYRECCTGKMAEVPTPITIEVRRRDAEGFVAGEYMSTEEVRHQAREALKNDD